ncbi:hypothetical protein N431DRAFT_419130 [Stipitochalara longipes BDJ]|nr:hypothetical protein N431DRAFT_419130 [Stipitochalara longipes BDJ]
MAPPKFKFGSKRPVSRNSSNTSASSRRVDQNPIQARKAPTKNERPMKAIFKGKVISIAGTIMTTSKSDPQQITYEAISKWITAHGGTYEREVGPDTTHLICSIEEYKKRTQQVQKAWELGKKQCKIVVFDWLEDCLLGKRLKKGLRPEGPYTLDRTIARVKKGFTDHAEYRRKFEEGARASKALVDNSEWVELNHVYCDPFDHFEYKVTLTRVNIGGRVQVEKYTCYLFESNAGPPSHFMFGAMLSRSHRKPSYVHEHCKPTNFAEAFYWFKHFFNKKTGIYWDQRLEGIKMGDEFFVYTPPVLGRPVGYVAEGYVRPELRVQELSEESGEGETTEAESEGTEKGEEVVYDTDSEVEDGDDSEDDGTARTVSSASRADSEDEGLPTRPNAKRDQGGDEFGGSVDSSFGNIFDRSFSSNFGGSFGGNFDAFGSSRGSEESGETEPTLTLTQENHESDRLRAVLEEAATVRMPPGLIYLSD